MTTPPRAHPDEIVTSPFGDGDADALMPDSVTVPRALSVEARTMLHLRRCKLEVIEGPDTGKEFVSEKDRIRIGQHRSNEVVLTDRTVSRMHCELVLTDKGHLAIDLGSTNGTFIDGQQVERAYVRPGSTVTVGNTKLRFSPIEEEIAVEPTGETQLGKMIGQSRKMREIFGLIKKIAPMDVSVIVQGETGTGKELAARAIHEFSERRKGPFVVIDCGAIPPNLIESEFFGHEKGAFTGAVASRPGAFERANGGTIFLDELGELRLDLQPKLLRVLENREVRRVGGNQVIEVDVRVIAATNRDLIKEVREGGFREDLYFRLSVINIQVPALRERKDDIALIVRSVLDNPETVAKYGRKRLSPAAMNVLQGYHWPGNVRELINVLSHVLTFADGLEVDIAHLPPRLRGSEKEEPLPFNEHLPFKEAKENLLEEFEREYLSSLLKRCGGNVSRAARESALHRKTIERLAKKYNLDAKSMKDDGTPDDEPEPAE